VPPVPVSPSVPVPGLSPEHAEEHLAFAQSSEALYLSTAPCVAASAHDWTQASSVQSFTHAPSDAQSASSSQVTSWWQHEPARQALHAPVAVCPLHVAEGLPPPDPADPDTEPPDPPPGDPAPPDPSLPEPPLSRHVCQAFSWDAQSAASDFWLS